MNINDMIISVGTGIVIAVALLCIALIVTVNKSAQGIQMVRAKVK